MSAVSLTETSSGPPLLLVCRPRGYGGPCAVEHDDMWTCPALTAARCCVRLLGGQDTARSASVHSFAVIVVTNHHLGSGVRQHRSRAEQSRLYEACHEAWPRGDHRSPRRRRRSSRRQSSTADEHRRCPQCSYSTSSSGGPSRSLLPPCGTAQQDCGLHTSMPVASSSRQALADPSVAYALLEKLGTGSFGTVWKA